jgi:hypothetical protein
LPEMFLHIYKNKFVLAVGFFLYMGWNNSTVFIWFLF